MLGGMVKGCLTGSFSPHQTYFENTKPICILTCNSLVCHAGMFGVGGGIIKAPLMLEMGVLPEVASATSATMIWVSDHLI